MNQTVRFNRRSSPLPHSWSGRWHRSVGRTADLIFGQGCSAAEPSRFFCRTTAHAKRDGGAGDLQGEIVVTSPEPQRETWTLELRPWANYYDLPATQGALDGHYKEELADFAQNGDTIVNVDGGGHLSFESASSGCRGDGNLMPHKNGSVNVYDAVLTISDCQPPYDYLNAEFSGLATTSPSTIWDYDVLLRIWLTQTNPDVWDTLPPALTMSGRLQ